MENVGSVEYIAQINSSGLAKDARVAEASVEKLANTTQKTLTKGMDNFGSAAQIALGAVTAAVGLLGVSFIHSASELQSLRASFESLTGSADGADAVMRQMYQFGKVTAFTNQEIQTAARSFLAVGVSTEQLGTLMQQAGDIAGATGANLGQFTLPLTQAIARGKLQTQDFYQILNSGAGAFRKNLEDEVIKRGLGNLQDALSNGTITTEVLTAALATATQEGGFAFEGAIKQSQTFAGRMSNLRESIINSGLSILGVDAETGAVKVDGLFASLSKLVSVLTNNMDVIKNIVMVITILLIPALIRLGVQALFAGANIAKAWLLALGPIGLIIAAVAAVTALIVTNWDWIKEKTMQVWEAIKNAVASAFNWVKENWPLLLAIITGPIGLATMLIIKNFDKIKDALASVWNWTKDMFGKIGDVASGIFKKAVNFVLSFVEMQINSVISVINGAISAIDKVTPGNIGRIGSVSIPRLAEGGIVTAPTLAMVGEGRESEAVIPLSKLDEMIGGGGGSGSSTTVNISLSGVMASSRADLRAVGKDLISAVNEELRAKNMPQIGVA